MRTDLGLQSRIHLGGLLSCAVVLVLASAWPVAVRMWWINQGNLALARAVTGNQAEVNLAIAEQSFLRASGGQCIDWQLCWDLGRTYLASRQADRAVEHLRAAAELAPQNRMIHLALGDAYDLAGQRDQAVLAWRKAEAASTFNRLGDLSWQQRNMSSAEEYYWKAAQTDPGYVEPLYGLQNIYWAVGDKRRLEDVLVRTLTVDTSSSARRWVTLGILHQIRSQPDMAIECYQQALILQPQWSLPYRRLAEVWWGSKGNGEKAAFYYEQVIQIAPDDWGAYVALGDIYRAQGRLADARAAYLRALALDGLEEGARRVLQEHLELMK